MVVFSDILNFSRRAFLFAGLVVLLLGASAHSVEAQNKTYYNRNAYTGKRAWWLNYQYFPALEKIDVSDDTIPDLQQRLSFFAGIGYSGLRLKQDEVDFKMHVGAQIGARYDYLVCKHFGFRSGLDISFASSEGYLDNFSDYYYKVDEEFDEMEYMYSFSRVDEDYKLFLFDIPLQLVFNANRFSVGCGLKVALPVLAYKQNVQDIHTSAYYPQYDVLVDDAWMIACGSYPSLKSDNSFTRCQIMFIGTLDMSYDFKISDKYSVGVGAYVDYSASHLGLRGRMLSDKITDENAVLTITDKVPVDIVGKSFLGASKNDLHEDIISSIRYFSAGIKLSFNLNWYGPEKPRTKPY